MDNTVTEHLDVLDAAIAPGWDPTAIDLSAQTVFGLSVGYTSSDQVLRDVSVQMGPGQRWLQPAAARSRDRGLQQLGRDTDIDGDIGDEIYRPTRIGRTYERVVARKEQRPVARVIQAHGERRSGHTPADRRCAAAGARASVRAPARQVTTTTGTALRSRTLLTVEPIRPAVIAPWPCEPSTSRSPSRTVSSNADAGPASTS